MAIIVSLDTLNVWCSDAVCGPLFYLSLYLFISRSFLLTFVFHSSTNFCLVLCFPGGSKIMLQRGAGGPPLFDERHL